VLLGRQGRWNQGFGQFVNCPYNGDTPPVLAASSGLRRLSEAGVPPLSRATPPGAPHFHTDLYSAFPAIIVKMKSSLSDYLELVPLLDAQHGVLLASDLQAFWADRSPQVLAARLTKFVEEGVLRKICRGAYVGKRFDPWVLAGRLYPDSVISTVSVLSRHGLVGTVPTEQVWCVRPGRSREHLAGNLAVRCWSMDPSLTEFGIERHGAIRLADAEKAFLDTLYFHLHGRTYPFCVPHDIQVERLDKKRIEGYLEHYRNPRFQAFVRGVVG